jgi:hypothetical protein
MPTIANCANADLLGNFSRDLGANSADTADISGGTCVSTLPVWTICLPSRADGAIRNRQK